MLSFNKQYDIAHTTYFAYRNFRIYKRSPHKQKTRDKVKKFYRYEKYTEINEKLFRLVCIHICFEKNPKNLTELFFELNKYNINSIKPFVDIILRAEEIVKFDIIYLKDKERLDVKTLINLFIKKKIQYYTLYYILLSTDSFEALKDSLIYQTIYRKLKFISLYIKISDSVRKIIQDFVKNNLNNN